MQHTLRDKYNGLYSSIVMLVEATAGSENRYLPHMGARYERVNNLITRKRMVIRLYNMTYSTFLERGRGQYFYFE